jgi:hypothetical protein
MVIVKDFSRSKWFLRALDNTLTGHPEALEPGNSCVLSVTHPERHGPAALSHTTPCYTPPRHAAAASGGGPEARGGSSGGTCLVNVLSVRSPGRHLLALGIHRIPPYRPPLTSLSTSITKGLAGCGTPHAGRRAVQSFLARRNCGSLQPLVPRQAVHPSACSAHPCCGFPSAVGRIVGVLGIVPLLPPYVAVGGCLDVLPLSVLGLHNYKCRANGQKSSGRGRPEAWARALSPPGASKSGGGGPVRRSVLDAEVITVTISDR